MGRRPYSVDIRELVVAEVWLKLADAAGANLFYLSPYCPDLNPIEMIFVKLKTLLRKAAERTRDALSDRIGKLLDAFTPQECANCLAHAGYARC